MEFGSTSPYPQCFWRIEQFKQGVTNHLKKKILDAITRQSDSDSGSENDVPDQDQDIVYQYITAEIVDTLCLLPDEPTTSAKPRLLSSEAEELRKMVKLDLKTDDRFEIVAD
jgi:hypothetical protein